jgi:hypothetical protein
MYQLPHRRRSCFGVALSAEKSERQEAEETGGTGLSGGRRLARARAAATVAHTQALEMVLLSVSFLYTSATSNSAGSNCMLGLQIRIRMQNKKK